MSVEPRLIIDGSTPLRAAWSVSATWRSLYSRMLGALAAGDLAGAAQGQTLVNEPEQSHRLLRTPARRLCASHHPVQAALRRVGATMTRVRRDRAHARAAGAPSYDFRADRILRDAHAYWEDKRGARAMPRRSDINPTELPGHLLPQLQLIDVLDGGQRFYFRLVGTAIVEAFGGEFTGKYTEEVIAADRLAFLHGCYRMVVTSRRPVVVRSSYLTDKAADITANRLLMPLSQDGEQVNIILGALTFEPMGRRLPDDAHLPYIDVVP